MANDKFPRVVTPEFRAVYVWVTKPQPPLQEGQEAKFKCGMLFDKKNPKVMATLKEITKTADDMLKERWPKSFAAYQKQKAANPKMPAFSNSGAFQPWLRNGDTDDSLLENDLMKGMFFVQAKSKDAPGIVDKHRKLIVDPDEFYAGCYALASCAMFTYDKAGNKGAGLLLNNIMKLRDGERISGKRDPESDFKDVEVEGGGADDEEDPF